MNKQETALVLPAITPPPSRKAILEALVRIELDKRLQEVETYTLNKQKLLLDLKKKFVGQVITEMQALSINDTDFPFHNMELSFGLKEGKDGTDRVTGINIIFNVPMKAKASACILNEASAYQKECDNEFSWRYTDSDTIRREIREAIKNKKAKKPQTSSADLVNNPSAKEALTNMLNVLFNEEE